MAQVSHFDWPQGVEDQTLLEIIEMGDRSLAAQTTIALAQDARATAQANILITLAAALLGGIAAFLTVQDHSIVVLTFLVLGALGVLAGAAMSGYAARPVAFHINGYPPRSSVPVSNNRTEMNRRIARSQQECIDANAAHLEQAARWTVCGYRTALGAIGLMALASGIASLAINHRSSSSAPARPTQVEARKQAPVPEPAPVSAANRPGRRP